MGGRASNGEGSLYHRKSDGRWVGAVFIGYDHRGKARRKTVSAKTRADAARKLQQLQRDLQDGLPPSDDRFTLGALFDVWLDQVVPLQAAPGTVANYSSLVTTHLRPSLGRIRLTALRPDDVQQLIHAKLEEGLSTRTVRLLRGLLVQVLNYAVRQGRVPRNVAVLTTGPRQQGPEQGRSMTVEQARTFLASVKGDRLEALYVLMLATGLRPGEAFGLPWSNVDFENHQLTVRQALVRHPGGNVIGPGKTGRKGWRTVQLPGPVSAALLSHRERQEKERSDLQHEWDEHHLVFCTPTGTPLDPDNHRREFAKLTERAGIGRWHPHEMRHTATSILLAQGVPIEVVSKVLGHTSIRITADVYGHMLESQQETAANAMGFALWDCP